MYHIAPHTLTRLTGHRTSAHVTSTRDARQQALEARRQAARVGRGHAEAGWGIGLGARRVNSHVFTLYRHILSLWSRPDIHTHGLCPHPFG